MIETNYTREKLDVLLSICKIELCERMRSVRIKTSKKFGKIKHQKQRNDVYRLIRYPALLDLILYKAKYDKCCAKMCH